MASNTEDSHFETNRLMAKNSEGLTIMPAVMRLLLDERWHSLRPLMTVAR